MSPKLILTSFGATTALLNAALYFALRNEAKWHGHVQLGMSLFGVLCFIVGLNYCRLQFCVLRIWQAYWMWKLKKALSENARLKAAIKKVQS